jgi:hypothetical protein
MHATSNDQSLAIKERTVSATFIIVYVEKHLPGKIYLDTKKK